MAKRHWYINGTHYSRTLEDWLKLHDRSRRSVMPLFEATYGKHQASRCLRRGGAGQSGLAQWQAGPGQGSRRTVVAL